VFSFNTEKSRWEAAFSAIVIPDGGTMGVDVEYTEPGELVHITLVRGSNLVAFFSAHHFGCSTIDFMASPGYRVTVRVNSLSEDELAALREVR
jgi:glutamine amidotransferase-like uncharacterized protein